MTGRPRAPHGTQAAFNRHKREHTDVCDECAAWKSGEKAARAARRAEEARVALRSRILAEPEPWMDAVSVTDEMRARDDIEDAFVEAAMRRYDPRRPIDLVIETRRNIHDVEQAIAWTLENEPTKLAALSKRKSELLDELVKFGGAKIEKTEAPDPLDALLGGELDNVTQLRSAAS